MNHFYNLKYAKYFRHRVRQWVDHLRQFTHACIPANCAMCEGLVMNDGVVCLDCQPDVQHDLYLPQQQIVFSESWAFSECWAVVAYAGLVKSMIHQIKFQCRYDLIKPLLGLVQPELTRLCAEQLMPAWQSMAVHQPIIVCALPSDARAVQQRGFDFTHLLTQCFLREALFDIPVIHANNCLIQAPASAWHSHLPQHQQPSREARLNAMRTQSPFCVSAQGRRQFQGQWQGATVMVCDDVVTTGATLDAAARVLRQAGAGRVIGLSLARTLPRS
jgi:predicted amidophosphoribosyltransferase